MKLTITGFTLIIVSFIALLIANNKHEFFAQILSVAGIFTGFIFIEKGGFWE